MRVFKQTSVFCLLAALILSAGCHESAKRTLGTAFEAAAATPVQKLAVEPAASKVIVEGEMIEKCPVAGCWFVLKDKTGVVRIDTKSAGFVVSEVPVHTRLTVAGTVTPGAQPGIAATGVRY